jgi:hypothetical protein
VSDRALHAVPSVDEIIGRPELAAQLTLDAAEALLVRAHVAQALLLGRLLILRAAAPAPNRSGVTEDGAVGLAEAAAVLSMRPSTLYKKWQALNIGYKDVDGHVKFRRAALHRYLARKGG